MRHLKRVIRIAVLAEPGEMRIGPWWDICEVFDENTGDSYLGELPVHEFYALDDFADTLIRAMRKVLIETGGISPKMLYELQLRVLAGDAVLGQTAWTFRGQRTEKWMK